MKGYIRRYTILLLAAVISAGTIYYASHNITLKKSSGKSLPQLWKEALRGEYGAPEYESIDKNKPLKEQTVTFEMAGRTFKMPKVYIQSNLGGKRKITGINLVYVMPDFTSMGDFKNREEYMKSFNARDHSHMLLQDKAITTPIKQIIMNKEKGGRLTKYEGNHFGLEKYIDFDDPRHLNIKYDDTYIEKDENGEVISFISCSPDEEVIYPGCRHIFTDKGLRYSIYFNKAKYLPTWREHRKKAIEFIDSFEIKKPEKQEKARNE